MSVASSIKQAIGIPDEVAALESRAAACAVELAVVGVSQSEAERSLLDCERRADTKGADAAALKMENTHRQIDRLRTRSQVIAQALHEAKASKAAEAKAARCEALKVEGARANAACDAAEKTSVALCLKLAGSLGVYANEGAAARAAASSLERETGAAVGCARRSMSLVTAEAIRQAATLSTFDIALPVIQ